MYFKYNYLSSTDKNGRYPASQVPHSSVPFSVVIAKPAEACGPLENNVRGKAVLVRRGNCPFVVCDANLTLIDLTRPDGFVH